MSDSEIYCTGQLLKQVQTAKLFDDDKYFVDMKLLASPGKFFFFFLKSSQTPKLTVFCTLLILNCFILDIVLQAFNNLTSDLEVKNQTINSTILNDFLKKFFDDPGKEFEAWTPLDWHEK